MESPTLQSSVSSRGKFASAAVLLVLLGAARLSLGSAGPSWDPWFAVAHFGFFAILASALMSCAFTTRRMSTRAAVALGGTILGALVVETVQPLIGQEADVGDMFYGVSGGVSAVLVYAGRRSVLPRLGRLLVYGGVLVALAAMLIPAITIADAVGARHQFPVLASFESPWEVRRWEPRGCSIQRTRAHATQGQCALEISVSDPAAYPGVTSSMLPCKWLGGKAFRIDVYSAAGDGRTLWVRLDDRDGAAYDDRVQIPVRLAHGVNAVAIDLDAAAITPSGRRLNLSNIVAVTVFFDGAEAGDRFYLDDMRVVTTADENARANGVGDIE